jgi:hypothetical protein
MAYAEECKHERSMLATISSSVVPCILNDMLRSTDMAEQTWVGTNDNLLG